MESLLDAFSASGQPDLIGIRSQLQGAAQALVATGDLAPGAVHEVLTEFEDRLEERGMAQRVQAAMSTGAKLGAARPADGTEPPQPPSPQPRGPVELQAVVPINETIAELDDYTVIAISLELWSTHVSFRYAVHGEDMRRLLRTPGWGELRWEAHDERGGTYPQSGGSAGGGGTGGLTGQVNFAGPIADGARQFIVRLRYRDQRPMSVLVDLPGHDG